MGLPPQASSLSLAQLARQAGITNVSDVGRYRTLVADQYSFEPNHFGIGLATRWGSLRQETTVLLSLVKRGAYQARR